MSCESSFYFLRLSGKYGNVLACKAHTSSILGQYYLLRLLI